jgi:hypothetical protein
MNQGRNHSIQSKLRGVAIGGVALLASSAAIVSTSVAEEVVRAVNAVALGPTPLRSFDISFIDRVTGKYYLGDRANNQVDVLSPLGSTTPTNTPVGHGLFTGATGNNNTSGPDGVLVANNHTEIWAGNGDSHVLIFKTDGTFLTSINTGGNLRADELCEDPVHHLVMVANNAEPDGSGSKPFVTLISTGTAGSASGKAVVRRITFDGNDPNAKFIHATNGAEQCQWSPITGVFYLNLPEVNGPGDNSAPGATVTIDPVKMVVTQSFTIPHSLCAGPQGMAVGLNRQLALGCVGTVPLGLGGGGLDTVVINSTDGHVLYDYPGQTGNDMVWFNTDDNHFYFAAGNAGKNQLGITDSSSGQLDQNVHTAAGSHSVAASGNPATIYLPVNSAAHGLCSQFGIADSQGCLLILQANIPEDE